MKVKKYVIRFVGDDEIKIKEELEKIAKSEFRSLKQQMIVIFKRYIEGVEK